MNTIFIFLTFVITNVSSYSYLLTRMFASKSDLPATALLNFPKLSYHELTEQDKYDLQWYVIGKPGDFMKNKPYKKRIWNKNYVVWRNDDGEYRALDDVCTHKAASLSGGRIINDTVMCPYHGYEFNCNGTLTKVPGICFQPSPIYDVGKYNIVEHDEWVYINTYQGNKTYTITTQNELNDTIVHTAELETNLYIANPGFSGNIIGSPEENCSMVHLEMDYNCYSRVLSENSLDVMHIAYVHTFGNARRPDPTKEFPPKMIGKNHYKTTYLYEAGEDSMARKAFGVKDLIVENEFILPHTTIARVKFGDFVSTVKTFALPIGDNKSKLFVKTYRNFWENKFGDVITRNTMYNTMLQDKVVVENIDRRFMDGKFNMRFDKLQNTYKSFYKRFVEGENRTEEN